MKLYYFVAIATVSLVFSAIFSSTGIAQRNSTTVHSFTAKLTGAAEEPQRNPSNNGGANVTIYGQNKLCYKLYANINDATAAHIHKGTNGFNGAVVIPLATPTEVMSTKCVLVKSELLQAISSDPADYYVNIHNRKNPNGAMRGQLTVKGAMSEKPSNR